jgi:molybdenum-dependent DNA-binding transcriptional regulator ModE
MKTTDTTNIEPEDCGSLPAKQELALRAVISHPTLKDAAQTAGISETTLWRYMQDAEFSRRLREARREAVGHAVLRLQKASSDAVTVLGNIMMSESAPASARITAARAVLDYSMRAVETDELRGRIEELEEFVRAKQEEDMRGALLAERGKLA